MKLTVLGCTGSMSGPESAASSYLLQALVGERVYSLVLDMGPGAFGALWRALAPAPVESVDAVFLSHGHADHIADIMSLHVYTKWFPTGSRSAVPVFGPPGMLQRIQEIEGAPKTETYQGVFAYQDLVAGQPVTIGPFQVTPYQARHSVPAMGFRIQGPGGWQADSSPTAVFCYTGDTDTCDSIVEMATNCDLLLSECGFTEADSARGIHLTGVRAAKIAKAANVHHLVLTHIQPWTDKNLVLHEVAQVDNLSCPVDLAAAGRSWII